MTRDRFDRIVGVLLAVSLAALGAILATASPGGPGGGAALDKAMEQEMAYQARASLLQKIYAPVEELRSSGQPQQALFKLDDLERRYPGQAHGHILRGEILREMGALRESVEAFVAGVRLSGDYVDGDGPLSRRKAIESLVEEGMAAFGERARAQSDNASLRATMKNLYYLQGRLAGGCE